MGYPVGMETRLVQIPAIFTTSGGSVKATIRVSAARSFIWAATGEAFLAEPIVAVVAGTTATVELPVPGQAGFIDGAGNEISDWTYTASFAVARSLNVPDVTFDLPSGPEPLVITPDVSRHVFAGVVNTPVPVVGIQGPQGEPGPQGEQGPQGPSGAGAEDATAAVKGVLRLTGDLGGTADAPTVPGLADKAPAVHSHVIADVAGLQAALDGKQPAGSYAAAAHTHTIANVTGLQTALDGKMAIPFADPNADRIVFWDDSAGAFAALQVGGALRLLGTQLDIPLATVGTQGAIQVASDAAAQLGLNSSDAVPPSALRTTRGRYVDVNAQTGTSYTPVATDQGKLVTLNNASAIAVTLPQDSAAAFPVGASVDFLVLGAGAATFTAGTGATVNPTSSTSRAQYSILTAIKIGVNTWVVGGDTL